MKTSRWSGMAFVAWLVLGTGGVFPAEPSTAATEPSTTVEQTKAERLQAILTETLPESEYRELTRCLSTRVYRRVEILSDQYLIFKGSRNRVWVNRLRHRCPGLRRHHILKFDLFGQNICDMDRVSAIDRSFGDISASCSLGPFEEIDEQRAAALKEAFRQARRS